MREFEREVEIGEIDENQIVRGMREREEAFVEKKERREVEEKENVKR